jgi:hypothetical protein
MKASHELAIAVAIAAATLQTITGQREQRVPQANQHQNRANSDPVVKEFKTRIDDYMKAHDKGAKAAPPLKETPNPAQIKNAQDSLAARIRELRADARQGDIFTPAVAARFKRLLSPELKGEDGHDAKQILKDDAPAAVPLKVNAKYPSKAPLPTVPSKLLLSLPPLPKELEYRIVQKHLILRDVEADLIVDFIPNAIR